MTGQGNIGYTRRSRNNISSEGAYSSGMISLILIFAVLCMIVLSLLSWSSSRTDLQMSLRSMEQNTAYFDACTEASSVWEQLYAALSSAASEQEFFRICEESVSIHPDLLYDSSGRIFSLDLDYTDTQSLHIEFAVSFPDSEDIPPIQTTCWQSRTIGEWRPDTRQQVYQKENLNE